MHLSVPLMTSLRDGGGDRGGGADGGGGDRGCEGGGVTDFRAHGLHTVPTAMLGDVMSHPSHIALASQALDGDECVRVSIA